MRRIHPKSIENRRRVLTSYRRLGGEGIPVYHGAGGIRMWGLGTSPYLWALSVARRETIGGQIESLQSPQRPLAIDLLSADVISSKIAYNDHAHLPVSHCTCSQNKLCCYLQETHTDGYQRRVVYTCKIQSQLLSSHGFINKGGDWI